MYQPMPFEAERGNGLVSMLTACFANHGSDHSVSALQYAGGMSGINSQAILLTHQMADYAPIASFVAA